MQRCVAALLDIIGQVDESPFQVDLLIKKSNAIRDPFHQVQGIEFDFLTRFSSVGIGL